MCLMVMKMTLPQKSHERINKGAQGYIVNFTASMKCTVSKEEFLSNSGNKQGLIRMIGEELHKLGHTVHNADGYAACLIIQTAMDVAQHMDTVVIGEDTDI